MNPDSSDDEQTDGQTTKEQTTEENTTKLTAEKQENKAGTPSASDDKPKVPFWVSSECKVKTIVKANKITELIKLIGCYDFLLI